MPKPERLRYLHQELLERAKANTPHNPDRSAWEDHLIDNVISLMDVDVEAIKRREAKKIVSEACRPGGTPPEGQLLLPGLDPYDFEPLRLIRDGKGSIIEARHATIDFKQADTERAEEHANEALHQAQIKRRETTIHERWARQELMKGRPVLELTWGNCVIENGLLRGPPPPGDGVGADAR